MLRGIDKICNRIHDRGLFNTIFIIIPELSLPHFPKFLEESEKIMSVIRKLVCFFIKIILFVDQVGAIERQIYWTIKKSLFE